LQLQFGKKILKAMGFTPEDSRLDISVHPFCMPVHPLDTRMTTRTHHDDIMSNILSAVHEGGHGLYNKGLNLEQFGSPLGEQSSLGIDESQSRWWETRLPGQNLSGPISYRYFNATFLNCKKLSSINSTLPSIKSVLLSSEWKPMKSLTASTSSSDSKLKKPLLEGTLKVKDIPEVWNQKMHDYLGIRPSKDSEGCLQDIHWSFGLIGYFPTYVLGNLYSAQFFNTFEKAHPDWQTRVSKGDLGFIREWLRTNIHQYGRQYTPEEFVQRISGKPLHESDYVNYLNTKYKEIYRF
jgi:carboxypeptidase Taq